MDPGQPVVVVSLKDIYDTLVKLVSAVDRLADQQIDVGKDLADHETRIRRLEDRRFPLQSLAVIASIGSLVVAFLAFYTQHH